MNDLRASDLGTRRIQPLRRQVCGMTWVAAMTALLSACALPSRPEQQLKPEDYAASAAMNASLVDASRALTEANAQLHRELERTAPAAVEPSALQALPDPLASKTISISMQNARIGQLLWILSKDYGLSLSIDPPVLEMPQTANLYLQQVTVRQALENILKVFDVSGTVGDGGVLSVKMSEERLFNLEVLAAKSTLELAAGGDSLGGKAADSGMKNTLGIRSEIGDKADPIDSVVKMIEAIIKEEEGSTQIAGQGSAGAVIARERARMSVNRATGSMYVRAKPSVMRSIDEVVKRESSFRKSQIQIDAQLLDVTLNNDSRYGVDWNILGNKIAGQFGVESIEIAGTSAAISNTVNSLAGRVLTIPGQTIGFGNGSASGGIGYGGDKFSVALNALKQFGSVRVLSNPSIMMRNGVPAYLNVGNTIRYIEKITSNTNNAIFGTTRSIDVTTESIFSGVVVGVSAVVKKDGLIEIFIQPSQTQVNEKSLDLVDLGSGNKVTLPRVSTKSLATTLNMRSGDTVVIGGLIDRQESGVVAGLPGVMEVPGLGRAFSTEGNQSNARELVVVLRARAL